MAKKANIGSLIVSLVANVSPFEREMRKARGMLKKFGIDAKSFGGLLKSGAFLGGLTAATGGLVAFARASSKARAEIDKLAKTSQRLGIELNQLRALQFAGQLAGIETSTFNMALQRMIRRVAEAAQGTGEAVSALDELGLSARRLAQLSPDQQFRRIANALFNVANASDQVRLAFKLFDSEGVALLQLIKEGEMAINEMTREFSDLAGTIDDEAVASVERFNDAWLRMVTVLKGIVEPSVVGTTKLITGTIEEFTRYMNAFRKAQRAISMLPQGAREALRGVPANPNLVGPQTATVPRTIGTPGERQAITNVIVRTGQGAVGAMGGMVGLVRRGLNAQTSLAEEMRKQIRANQRSINKPFQDAWDAFRDAASTRAAKRRRLFLPEIPSGIMERIEALEMGGLKGLMEFKEQDRQDGERALNKIIFRGTSEAYRLEQRRPDNVEQQQLEELKDINRKLDINTERINIQVGGLA